MTAVLLNLAGTSAGLSSGTVAVDPAIQMLQSRGAQCHNHGTEDKESNAAFKRHLLKNRIRIPGESASADSSREFCTHHPLRLKHRSIQIQYPTAKLPDRPRAGRMSIVQGGEKKSRSINSTIDGTAWKLTSAPFR